MASCQTARWGNNNTSPYIKLTVTEKESNETSVTLSWVLQYIADYAASAKNKKEYSATIAGDEVTSGYYDINGKVGTYTIASGTKIVNKTKAAQSIAFSLSFMYNGSWSDIPKTELTASGTISVAAKSKYTVKYNLNGGSGTFADQTKWHAENLTLHTGEPTKAGYTFGGWALSQEAANKGEWYYKAGYACGQNKDLTLYAIWIATSYTVSYNANGGASAPLNQTKTPDVELTLSSTQPTRSGYVFKGWSNAATSATVLYRPGDKYTANASITLYAVWVRITANISNFSVDRCDSDGTLNENGTCVKVEFDYSNATATLVQGYVAIYEFGSTTIYDFDNFDYSYKTSEHYSYIFGSSNSFDIEKSYTVTIKLNDFDSLKLETSLVLGGAADSLEFIPGNKGIRLPKIVYGNVVGLSDLTPIPENASANTYTEPGAFAVASHDIAKTLSNFPEKVPGTFFVSKSLGGDSDTSDYRYRMQFFVPYMTTSQIYIRHINKNDSGTWVYGAWKALNHVTTDIDFTPASDVTVNRCMLSRCGDIVTMFLSCKVTAAMSLGTVKQIGTIASDRPGNTVSTVGMQNHSLVTCWIQSTGAVNIRPSTAYAANTDIEFNMTWNVAATWS